ncbi:MAG TPA: hypothetical protein VM029_05350, partial [Opitutaceae bacterium]|nr:hypothetical protein [Opitutaceae bacterium]
HAAAISRQLATVKLLLARGADYSLANRENATAYDLARRQGFFEIMEILAAPARGRGQPVNAEKNKSL